MRRKFLTYGGLVAASGLLIGYTGSSKLDATMTDVAATDTTATADATVTNESIAKSAANDSSYAVLMAPMSDAMFKGVPKSIFTRLTRHTGMVSVLGHGDAVSAVHTPDYYNVPRNQFTPRLSGVKFDWTNLHSSWEPSKGQLYKLDSDVYLAGPVSVSALGSWSQANFDEIEENISPWFGSSFNMRCQAPPTERVDTYEYYGLWEIFARIAQMFQAETRYEALAAAYGELLTMIAAGPPVEEDRPTTVLLGLSDLEPIYAYNLSTPGFLTAHIRPLKPVSMFGDDAESGSTVDSGTLLEADPDMVLAFDGMHPNTSISDIRTGFQDDSVGAKVSAVKDDRIYAQDDRYQGPILNLFQLETTAEQLPLDHFDAWSQYSEGPHPGIPEEE